MQAATTTSPQESRARELLADAFAGTPGRMRLLGALAVAACVATNTTATITLVRQIGFILGATALGEKKSYAACRPVTRNGCWTAPV